MSGLYNMLMGVNKAAPYLFGIVGITRENAHKLGRLRDVWINAEGTRVFVLRRNYGEEGAEADAEAAKLPGYVGKVMDSYDDTYGYYEYVIPQDDEKLAAFAKAIAEVTDNTPCMERYRKLIEDMKAGVQSPETLHALAVGKSIAEGLEVAMKTGQRVDVGSDGAGVTIETIKPEGENGT